MASADETLAAATALIQGLATSPPSYDFRPPNSSNGHEKSLNSLHLPGPPTAAKAAFEKELEALARRVHTLEVQAVRCPSPAPLSVPRSSFFFFFFLTIFFHKAI